MSGILILLREIVLLWTVRERAGCAVPGRVGAVQHRVLARRRAGEAGERAGAATAAIVVLPQRVERGAESGAAADPNHGVAGAAAEAAAAAHPDALSGRAGKRAAAAPPAFAAGARDRSRAGIGLQGGRGRQSEGRGAHVVVVAQLGQDVVGID